MRRAMRRYAEWSVIEGRVCRVTGFTPLMAVQDGRVGARRIFDPYASVSLECPGVLGTWEGLVTHSVDFLNLWAALREREHPETEEVWIVWTTREYKYGFLRFLSWVLPKMIVSIHHRGALELMMSMADPQSRSEPGEASLARAMVPVVTWRPKVMR